MVGVYQPAVDIFTDWGQFKQHTQTHAHTHTLSLASLNLRVCLNPDNNNFLGRLRHFFRFWYHTSHRTMKHNATFLWPSRRAQCLKQIVILYYTPERFSNHQVFYVIQSPEAVEARILFCPKPSTPKHMKAPEWL